MLLPAHPLHHRLKLLQLRSYGWVTIDEMYDFVEKAGVTVLGGTIKAATLNGAKMVHHEDEFGSLEAGKRTDLWLSKGDVATNIRDLTQTTWKLSLKEGSEVIRGTF